MADATEPCFDAFTRRLIQIKACILASRVGCGRDGEDWEQELRLHLLRRLPAYRPRRASFHAFVKTVISRYAANLLRDGKAKCRDPSRVVSLSQIVAGDGGRPEELAARVPELARACPGESQQLSPEEQRDLRIDLAAALRGLSPDSQAMATRLMERSKAEVARDLGLSRYQLHVRMRDVLRHFEKAGLREYLS